MNLFKKSQAKTQVLLFTGLIIVVVAILRHPSIKTMLSSDSKQSWQKLIQVLESDNGLEAQNIWQFREFYSRGTIYLSKYQVLEVPSNISSNFEVPTSFVQHMSFNSNKIQSIEGSIDKAENVFFNKEDLWQDWKITTQTDSVQIIEQNKDKALIIGLFDMETAGQANGYLHFDLRDDNFKKAHENKKWLVVSYVKL
jgi:hypothetical protein